MSNQIVITSGAKLRDLDDVIIGTDGILSSVAFNVANGVPRLDENGKILVSQLPNSVMEFKGVWNASTNSPTLANGTGNAGDVWLCNVAGTVNFGAGPIAFAVGDYAVYTGTVWARSSGATGTVTSVGVSRDGNALAITGSPVTTSGTINLGFSGDNTQYINGAGNLTTFPTLITSIGLTMPAAFGVSNSPLTANGTIGVTALGFPSQYIRGDGTLADFPTSGGGGSSVSYYLNGGTSQGTIGGTTYYEMSKIANTGTGVDFSKTGDGFITAFLTDAGDPALLQIPAGNWNYEIYASMSSNGGTPEMYAELYVYDGTTFTLLSTSAHEILYDGVNLNLYTFAMAVPETVLTITDRLAIKLYATNSGGKTTTIHTQDSHLCQIITTFTTGLTALNGLTAQVQYFGTGTSGSDFNIVSSVDTHTFNLPNASATKRGALSAADWYTFNNKQDYITAGTTLQYWRGDKTWQTLDTSVVPELTNLYFTNARARTAISLTTTGSTGASTYDNSTGVLNIPNYADQYVGTVTSVGLSAPTGFSVSGSPVTTSGTLALSFASGYSLPTNVKQSNWDDAYTWVAAFPTQTGNSGKFLTTDGSSLSWAANPLGTVTSVDMSVPTGLTVSGNPITTSGTLAVTLTAGYSIPTTANQSTWTTAYNRSLTSAAVTGTTTKTLTLNQQDGGTITASWTDYDTAPVTSVFGRTGAVVATEGDYTLTQLGDVTITTPTTGQVLKYNGTAWINDTDANTGTVTSVAMTVPTGLSISGSPITSSGTLAVTFAAGYSIPTNASQTTWDTAYTNRITSLTTTGTSGAATLVANVLNIPNYTTDLSGYLPLTGGTLTGLLTSTISSGNNIILNKPTGPSIAFNKTNSTAQSWEISTDPNFRIVNATLGNNALSIAYDTNVATFISRISANSGVTAATVSATNSNTTTDAGMAQTSWTSDRLRFGVSVISSSNGMIASNGANTGLAFMTHTTAEPWTEKFVIAPNGDSTFTKTVSAASFITGETVYTSNQIISGYYTNTENLDLWINYTGYQGGITRFRNLQIGDGKNNRIVAFVGSTKETWFYGNVGINTQSLASYPLTINSDTTAIRIRNNTSIRYRSDWAVSGGGASINAYDDTVGVYIPLNLDASNIVSSTNITATSFTKSGGTASQFLKANGTVDSTSYQSAITLTTTGTSGAATFVSNVLNIPNYSTSGSYLPLSGGTLTGRLSGIEIGVSRNGSDTVAVGPWFRWTNAAEDRQVLTQLNASNGLDWWAYDGTNWIKKATLSVGGDTTFTLNAPSNNPRFKFAQAGVFNRGSAADIMYWGETSDTGAYTFRGTGTAQFQKEVAAENFNVGNTNYISNQIQSGYNANSEDSDIWINYTGYQGGATRFRDFRVGNGKQTQIMFVDGSTGTTAFSYRITISNNQQGVASVSTSNSNSTDDAGVSNLNFDGNRLRLGVLPSDSAYGCIGSSGAANTGIAFVTHNGAGWGEGMRLTPTRNLIVIGDVTAYSDISVKENIRPIENVLARINNSRGVLYDRIDTKTKDNIGFIAQELEKEFPELIITNENGTKAVKYQNAVAVLFEAIKEQQKQINELKNIN